MKATQLLHNLGQSLWLDNITRDLLNSGTLKRYIDELSVTGLTSNPTIYDHTIKNGAAYDMAIREELVKGKSGESLFFDLALDDLIRAADLFRPVYNRTNGVDGWVSLEVSPLLAHDTARTIAAARVLSSRGGRPNLFIKIPGTKEGLPAIEEAIFEGVPVNVTLLFSREHYMAAAEAYLRGIERRIAAGLNPQVGSVASMFISRWDAAVGGKLPEGLNNRLGIAVAGRIYKAYLALLSNPRWQRAYSAGAQPQRLLWASTGTKDPKASDILYIKALAAPFTVNTMPEATLKALADHGEIGPIMAADGGDCEKLLDQFAQAGVNADSLAARLQDEGAKSFVKSWNELMAVIASKSDALGQAASACGVGALASARIGVQPISQTACQPDVDTRLKRNATNETHIMLTKAKTLEGYSLQNIDDETIGKVKEFYFDDQHWTVRYLVADTGNWLTGRQVLISPYALVAVNSDHQNIVTDLTKKQIEDSPSLDSDKPVSHQFERAYYGHYGYPRYWSGPFMWGDYPYPVRDREKWRTSTQSEKAWDPHLRSTYSVSGHHIQAADGEIGHVEDFIIDDETWAIRYLIVNTHNWWAGKRVLVSPQWIERVSWS